MNRIDNSDSHPRLIRLPEVMRRTGLSRPTIYRSMSAGDFPKSARFGGAALWAAHEIDRWVRDRLAERGAAAA